MKKIFKILLFFIVLSGFGFVSQSGPNWVRTNYMESTIFSGIVTINDKPASPDDYVGAFANNECRMIAKVFLNNDSSYVSSVIHGEKVEEITFKVWIASENKEYVIPQKIQSKPGDNIYLHKIELKK